MEHVDLTKIYDANAEAFAKAESFAAFIEAADLKTAFREHLTKYAGGWADISFLTHKHHGFVAKPLAMPAAKSFADIFAAVDLKPWPYNPTEKEGFVSATRADKVAFFGHLYAEHYIKTRADGRFFCFGVRKQQHFSTYALHKREVVQIAESSLVTMDRGFSYEIVKRSDNRLLVLIKDGHHIGSRWLALLPEGETLMSLYSDHERGEIQAAWDRDNEVHSLVKDDVIDFERAAALGVAIVKDKY